MRFLLLSAAALMTATALRAMHVVVIATDLHLVEYISTCVDDIGPLELLHTPGPRAIADGQGRSAGRVNDGRLPHRFLHATPTRRVVHEPARVDWHVLGGTPPYRLIDDRRDVDGNIRITVQDAEGRVATGYAVVRVRRSLVEVPCPDDRVMTTPATATCQPEPSPAKSTQRGVRSSSPNPRPDRGMTRTRDGRHTGGDGPGPRTATHHVGGTRSGNSGHGGNHGGTYPSGGAHRGTGLR